MSAFELNDAARRNARAISLGFRSHYERRRATETLRNLGFPLSNQANRRAFEGFLRAFNAYHGREGLAQATKPVMTYFTLRVQQLNLTGVRGGMQVTALLEDRNIIDPEERDWEEWWTAYV